MPWKDPYLKALTGQPRGWALASLHYIVELPLLILDILGFPEGFGFLQWVFKPNARALEADEFQSACFLFHPHIDLKQVRIDEKTRVGTQSGKYAYVSYYYINCSGSLSLPVLMHELVHILQFEQTGSPYIFRNLMAHWSRDKYNYGGITRLEMVLKNPDTLHQLNFEQRADIISDYYLIASGMKPEWGLASARDTPTYLEVIRMVIEAHRQSVA